MRKYLSRMFYEQNTKDKNYFLIGLVCIIFSPILIPIGAIYILYKAVEELGWVILGGTKP